MPIEIERKFLVIGDGWRAAAHKVAPMAQGYLNDMATMDSGSMRTSVRVRIAGEQAYLNLKSRALGHTRQEFDYAIPLDDAKALLDLSVGGLVKKNRHYVQFEGHLWEVDEFLGENAGLVVAEIELSAADATFAKPTWLGDEVTDEICYYNLALATTPYSKWRDSDQFEA